VNPQYGFIGNVTLTASGLPSDVTASFSPNSTNYTSTMTLTATGAAAVGKYTVTVTRVSGSLNESTTFSLVVYVPTFSLWANGINIDPGGSGTTSVTVTPQYGFAGNVKLAVSGLPTGVTAAFSPNPTTGNSTLTLTTNSSVAIGQYTVTVTGTSGAQTASTTLELGVNAQGFTVTSYGGASVGQGSSASSTVYVNPQNGFAGNIRLLLSGLPSGVTGSFSPNPGTGSISLTLTATSSAALGQYNAMITGKSGDLTVTSPFPVTIYAQDFSLYAQAMNIGRGGADATNVSVNPEFGFTGSVTLAASGLPAGVTPAWGTNPATGNSVLTLTASSTAALGQYNVIVTGTSGSMTRTTTFTLGVYAPSFTLASYYSPSIGQGSSTTSNIYITPQYGFTGEIRLTASGLPAGVTATFSPNPTTGNTTITLSASSSASLGQYTITVTGTSGAQSATTNITLGLYAPGFTLSANNPSIGQGASGTSSVEVNPQYGFTHTVRLSASGLPAGVTAAFSPNPTTGNTTLTVTANSSVVPGNYNATISGTSGTQTATAAFTLTVNQPGFTLSANGLNISPGTTGTSDVYVSPQYGFTGNVNLSIFGLPAGMTAFFTPNPTTGTSALTLTASNSVPLGQYNATITGTCGSLTASTTINLAVYASGFMLSANDMNIGQGTSGSNYFYVSPQNGFTGNVTLSATGLPSGVTASFSPNPTTGYSSLTLAATNSAPIGQYTVTVTGVSGSQTAATTFILGIYAPTFTVSAYGVTIAPGSSTSTTAYVNPQYGFTGNVTFSISGLPGGVTGSFSPNPATGSSSLTLTASSSAAPGQYNATITGKSGAQTATTTLQVTIDTPAFTISTNGGGSMGPGSSATSYVYIYGQSGFNGIVSFSISGLPAGFATSFSPNPATSFTTLTVTTSGSVLPGQYNATITGTSGTQTATTPFTVTVYLQSFTLSSYALNIGRGTTGSTTVYIYPQYGFTGSVTLALSGLPTGVTAAWGTNPATGSSQLTLTASSWAALGQYNVTVTGASGSLTTSTTLTLGIYVPGFTLSTYSNVSIGRGNSSTSYVTMSPQYGFTGDVTLSAVGLPSGVTASFTPNPTTGNSILTLTANSTASLGQYNVTIKGTSGQTTATSILTVGIYPQSFTLYDWSSVVDINRGISATTTVELMPQYGFTGNVALSASGQPSGVTASFSPATLSTGSSTLTLTASSTAPPGAAEVTITGTSGTFTASTTLLSAVVVNQTTPAITWSAPVAINYGAAITSTQLNAKGSVSGTLNYSPPAGTVLDGGTQTLSVRLTPTDTTDYTPVTKTVVLTVKPVTQTITFTAPANQTYGTAPFELGATASSGLTISYAPTTPTICTVSGSTVTLVGAGADCTIQTSQPGNGDYDAAATVTRSFYVYREAQTISFNALPSQTYGAPITLTASASSGLAVSFASSTTAVCTVSGTSAILVAIGNCTIRAMQSGNGDYLAATTVSQSFMVLKAPQTITFPTVPAQTYGAAPFMLNATASSGLAVAFTSTTPTICKVSGATVTLVGAGADCTIEASQAGNGYYDAAAKITGRFYVYREAQTIAFNTLPNQTLGAAPITLSASASSGLAVIFVSATTGVCTVSGATATMIATGTCTIRATQVGNSVYLAATTVAQSTTVKAN
jgi:uncharacterized membrane protein